MGIVAAVAMGGAAIYGSYTQAQAQKQQAEFQSQQAMLNAELASMQAEDALRKGDQEAQAVRRKTRQIIGEQKVALAAQGLDITAGDAALLQEETKFLGAMDEMTVQNNAWRQAWGFGVQSEDYRNTARFTQMSGRNAARNTILTGGLQAIGEGAGGFKTQGAGAGMQGGGTGDYYSSGYLNQTQRMV